MTEAAVKQAIITKALNRGNQTIVEIALANNVAAGTLRRWLHENKSVNKNSKTVKGLLDSGERYKHLKATFGQDAVIIGAYCRKNGFYPHQLAQWETEFMTNSVPISKQQPNVEIKALRAEVGELKKSILRKDKVLAETMALLILKKKASQIWGGNEAD